VRDGFGKGGIAVASIVGLLVGTVLGSGAFWQWRSDEVERMKVAVDLHEKIETKLLRVAQLRAELQDQSVTKDGNRIRREIEVLKDEVEAFETKLAALEGRAQREFPEVIFKLKFPPLFR